MSDYEDNYSNEYDTDYSDDDICVVMIVTITITKGLTTKDISLNIKYYSELEAINADSDKYYSYMNIIEPFIERLHPGWSIEEIRSEGFTDGSYFDLDTTSGLNE